jgi:hypothetical protein
MTLGGFRGGSAVMSKIKMSHLNIILIQFSPLKGVPTYV